MNYERIDDLLLGPTPLELAREIGELGNNLSPRSFIIESVNEDRRVVTQKYVKEHLYITTLTKEGKQIKEYESAGSMKGALYNHLKMGKLTWKHNPLILNVEHQFKNNWTTKLIKNYEGRELYEIETRNNKGIIALGFSRSNFSFFEEAFKTYLGVIDQVVHNLPIQFDEESDLEEGLNLEEELDL